MSPLERARRYARAVPGAVSGGGRGSNETFALACTLVHGFGLTVEECYDVLAHEFNPRCSPPWNDRGLLRKAREAQERGAPPPGKEAGWLLGGAARREVARRPPPPPRPVVTRQRFDAAALRRFYDAETSERDWWRTRSPVRMPHLLSPGAVLDALFRPGERVLVADKFASQGQWIYWRGRGWYRLGQAPGERARHVSAGPTGGPEGVWWLANPVDGRWLCKACGSAAPLGRVRRGRAGRVCPACGPADVTRAEREERMLSRRSWRNLTDVRHLMLEHDPPAGADAEEHARLWLSFLSRLPLPLLCVTTSGGKSVHAVFRLGGRTKEDFDAIGAVVRHRLERFGVDPAAVRAVQLTRLAGCRREGTGRQQELLYLDPAPDAVPVAQKS